MKILSFVLWKRQQDCFRRQKKPLEQDAPVSYTHLDVYKRQTLNGAAALGRADRIGSIEAGKQGDFVLLGTDTPHILPYYTGMNAVKLTIKGGRILNSN